MHLKDYVSDLLLQNWAIACNAASSVILFTGYQCAFIILLLQSLYINNRFTTSDERDCPLNLSISLSGEKENNNDS